MAKSHAVSSGGSSSGRGIDRLIVNSAFEEPALHWRYDRLQRRFELAPGRRPAGFLRASAASKSFDDPGEFIPLELANRVRERVAAWRGAGYPGATPVTQRLLRHWQEPDVREGRRLFFCQIEAIETLIWLTEAPAAERTGIDIPGDGGPFARYCAKMATGSGKTTVMGMLITWQVLNKAAQPQDRRYTRYVLAVAPGLTVKQRLQVLIPSDKGNVYDAFALVPPGERERMNAARVDVRNWHALAPFDPNSGPKVLKLPPESDEVFARRVLGREMRSRILVINDEAHHAWRGARSTKVEGFDAESATVWIEGLDRIHRARGIATCYDFSATPFIPSGKNADEEALFGWIVSDFGLNDAIEAGLVKTPRVVVRDDTGSAVDYKSRFYHIYADESVKSDLNRRASPTEPLPDLVATAYSYLSADWARTAEAWTESRLPTPPVMISVCNRTETAARVAHAFERGMIGVPELCDPSRLLHIDSRVLAKAEARDDAPPARILAAADDEEGSEDVLPTLKRDEEYLRRQVDTVGRAGEPGESIQNVISVGMLTEGWDARTVTHIMGLRAFSSQLLCEQVVGRGLRRASYDAFDAQGLFQPEYVNIFGIPFTFLPHEGGDEGAAPPPTRPQTEVRVDPEKIAYELSWPNVLRIDHEYRPLLSLDWDDVTPLSLDATAVPTLVELAATIDGKPHLDSVRRLEIEQLAERHRLQTMVFRAALSLYDQLAPNWKGLKQDLLGQVCALVFDFVNNSGKVVIDPPLFERDDLRRRVVLALSASKIVQHLWQALRFNHAERRELIFDRDRKAVGSTGDMAPWRTTRPCAFARKSHINVVVLDSPWEDSVAFRLDNDDRVRAWAKNDHLGLEIPYVHRGVPRRYRPDFIIALNNGTTLMLEVKGQPTDESEAKRQYLAEWTAAVSAHGAFGLWVEETIFAVRDYDDAIARHVKA